MALSLQSLGALPWRHAIKVASAVGVKECCMAVGEVVRHE